MVPSEQQEYRILSFFGENFTSFTAVLSGVNLLVFFKFEPLLEYTSQLESEAAMPILLLKKVYLMLQMPMKSLNYRSILHHEEDEKVNK